MSRPDRGTKTVSLQDAPAESELIRLFTAVELPTAAKAGLLSLQTSIPGLKWTTPENLHLTLRFIGEMPGEKVPAIKEALRAVQMPPFSLRLKRLGLFERSNQAILWAGLEDCLELLALKRRIDASLTTKAGLAPAKGQFSPHITLGRSKDSALHSLREFVEAHNHEVAVEFPTTSFVLFRSVLEPGGAKHYPEEIYFL